MTVTNISLRDFRNFTETSAEFDEKTNIIAGKNAQGKTNLLEALYYLTAGRSFRAKADRELIRFDRDSSEVRAAIVSNGREQCLEAKLFRGRGRQLFVNSVKLKSAAELSGKLTAVLFCPDDLFLMKAGAAARRKLLDQNLCQLRPRYAAALSEFNRLYEHKTRILRDSAEKPSLLKALDEFSGRLAEMSAELIYYRARYAKLLSAEAEKVHLEFSGGAEWLSLTYKTVKTIDDPTRKPAELLPMLLEHQRLHRQAELDSGLCLSGAHKDDLEMALDGNSVKAYASQGQSRTAALSLKLAEREILKAESGEYPILLLDDVLSELDESRQNYVLNRIGGGQVFITCCEDGRIADRTGGRVFQVINGEVHPS